MVRHRIVITGGPGSGKTECLERLRGEPALKEFAFLEEAARALLHKRPDYREHWDDFHLAVYRYQVSQEDELGDRSFVSDRGTADAFAFHPTTIQLIGTCIEAEYDRYDAVIQLGTSARLEGPHYHIDRIRTEPQREAIVIEEELKKVWDRHHRYRFVPAHEDFEEKFRAVSDMIGDLLRVETN